MIDISPGEVLGARDVIELVPKVAVVGYCERMQQELQGGRRDGDDHRALDWLSTRRMSSTTTIHRVAKPIDAARIQPRSMAVAASRGGLAAAAITVPNAAASRAGITRNVAGAKP